MHCIKNAPVEPAVSVLFGSNPLTEGRSYVLTYSNNKKAGTASVKVTGCGNFTGSKTLTFKLFRTYMQWDERWKYIPYGWNDIEHTAPRGYRWMTPANFTGDMALRVTFDGVGYPKRIQIFALRN